MNHQYRLMSQKYEPFAEGDLVKIKIDNRFFHFYEVTDLTNIENNVVAFNASFTVKLANLDNALVISVGSVLQRDMSQEYKLLYSLGDCYYYAIVLYKEKFYINIARELQKVK